jgi:hypothetical protein
MALYIVFAIRFFGLLTALLLIVFAWILFEPTLDPTFGKEINSSDYYLIIYPFALMGITLLIPIKAVMNKLRYERILILCYFIGLVWLLAPEYLNLHGRTSLPWWMLSIIIINMLCVIYQLRFKVISSP